MKKLSQYLLFTFFFITTCHANINITEEEINSYLGNELDKKVTLKDSVGIHRIFELDYDLHDLSTQIGRTSDKNVEVSGTVDGLLKIKRKQYPVKIDLNIATMPYYDPNKGELFLKDINLKNWKISPDKYQDDLQYFMPFIIDGLSSILNSTPVYTLDESRAKELLIKKFAEKIVVTDGALQLETSIF
ncbi:DUF1439 domain-containing protein [Otariodibacter oris]|uniref:Uncharacterized protein DUF1439 n=1 Tax=Otariodibacter oris TaxID=1032623 RepID=A0A420XI30_9PAST|nr:DUF1439 domain-containing protein [Otariodibacter oris]QGM80835.1 hypothetical protein A6A10_05175 [Otariodibacter oris]RKR76992.1 uncharacterized protein DUF1439 [Otariodibacter oris]